MLQTAAVPFQVPISVLVLVSDPEVGLEVSWVMPAYTVIDTTKVRFGGVSGKCEGEGKGS
jgi:hypothetical protein